MTYAALMPSIGAIKSTHSKYPPKPATAAAATIAIEMINKIASGTILARGKVTPFSSTHMAKFDIATLTLLPSIPVVRKVWSRL